MAAIKCPNCDGTLSAAELSTGWCEGCGKRVPAYVLTEATRVSAIAGRSGASQGLRIPEPAPSAAVRPSAAEPGTKRNLPTKALVLGAILVANALLAWAFAGTNIWDVVMIIGAGLVGMFLVGVVMGALRGEAMALRPVAFLFLYAGALFGSGFLVSHLFARGTVHVDNFSRHDVILELDGKPWLECARNKTLATSLSKGTYALVVRSREGAELDRRQIRVDERGDYILNVLNAQVYARGKVEYGGFSFGDPPPEERIQEPWFKVKVDYLFENPPSSITVSSKRGQVASASRTYLRRGMPEKSSSSRP